jgi:SNF2 family DNA or RNA helicase
MSEWNDISMIADYDVIVTTYTTLLREKDHRSKSQGRLLHQKWLRVVLDEGINQMKRTRGHHYSARTN